MCLEPCLSWVSNATTCSMLTRIEDGKCQYTSMFARKWLTNFSLKWGFSRRLFLNDTLKPRCDKRDFLSRGAIGGTAGRRVLIGLVDFQPSVAINAAQIRAHGNSATRITRIAVGSFFFAPRRGIVCLWTENFYIWHPDATLIKQNASCTAGDNRVNCNRISRAAVYDIPPAPPGVSAGQKIALIAAGL